MAGNRGRGAPGPVLKRDLPTRGCCMEGLSWMCLVRNHPNLKSKAASLRGRRTFSRGLVAPSLYSKRPLQASTSAFAAERARMHPLWGGEVDLPFTASHGHKGHGAVHDTEQSLTQRRLKFNLLPPTSSFSFRATCIPQPPAGVQPLLSCGRAFPLAGAVS